LNALLRDQNLIRFLLISISILGIIFIVYAYRKNKASQNTEAESDSLSLQTPSFIALQKPFGIWTDLFRALLIAISLIVTAALILILLPQQTIDKISYRLQSRHVRPVQEPIALLYLGDEIKAGQFRIRGVIKNIASTPMERLDATIRFYDRNRATVETVLVRLDQEIIAPNKIARLELVIPNYKMDFFGYTVEFKLREGSKISYKDMRTEGFP
jgi:hypothetical protein